MSEKNLYQPETRKKNGAQKKDPIRELGRMGIEGRDKRAIGGAAIRSADKKK